jgi:hypothetical protein
MKKRGGVKSVRMSSILSNTVKRPAFMEPLPHGKVYKPSSSFIPTNYKSDGPRRLKFKLHTPAGHAKVVVDKMLDEEEQQKAYDRFNLKFQRIQDRNIDRLNKGKLPGNTLWVCVRAGVDKGLWQPTDGSWEMLPTVLNGYYYNTDFMSLVKPDDISRVNLKNNFWVPSKYISKYIYPPPVQTTSSVMEYDD